MGPLHETLQYCETVRTGEFQMEVNELKKGHREIREELMKELKLMRGEIGELKTEKNINPLPPADSLHLQLDDPEMEAENIPSGSEEMKVYNYITNGKIL